MLTSLLLRVPVAVRMVHRAGWRWVPALLFGVTGAVSAQTIGGRVIDQQTRRPVGSIAVMVYGDSGRMLGSIRTDTVGIFYAMLDKGGRVRLRFVIDSATSFDADSIDVPNDGFVQREFVVRVPRAFFEFEVEKQVATKPGIGAPRFPPSMLAGCRDGEVLAQFVVDSTGAVRQGSFRVLKSSHEDFARAVQLWLPTARFYPAEIGGRHVAQMVQQPFMFKFENRDCLPATESLFPSPRPPSFPATPRPAP